MTNFYTLLQTLGVAGVSAIIYWLYVFFQEQFLLIKEDEEQQEKKKEEDENKKTIESVSIKEVKYEDKYLDKFNKIENMYLFQEEDIKIKKQKIDELLSELYNKNLDECDISKLEEIKQTADDFMIKHFLSRLKNTHVIENTPIGNVAMSFNNEKGSFEYYSDKNIPYRFLETVARKYVTTFHCKPLYVIMETEIEIANQKMKEEKEKEKNELLKNSNLKSTPKTKDIFANFKNMKPIQINKMPNKTTTNTRPMSMNNPNPSNNNNSNSSQILKENANRYTHLGKFSNFILLKAVDKSNYDKHSKLSYRDFIRMNKPNN